MKACTWYVVKFQRRYYEDDKEYKSCRRECRLGGRLGKAKISIGFLSIIDADRWIRRRGLGNTYLWIAKIRKIEGFK